MSLRLLLACGGCNATARSGLLERVWHPISPSFGWWGQPRLEDHTPPGWTMFDRYTGCTYCPVCSEELFGPVVNQDAAGEIPADFDHYAVLA